MATDILLALGYGLLFFLEPLPIAKFGLVPFLGGRTRSSDHERTDFQAPAVEVRPLSATLAALDITLANCPMTASLMTNLASLEDTGFRSRGSSPPTLFPARPPAPIEIILNL